MELNNFQKKLFPTFNIHINEMPSNDYVDTSEN